MYSSQYIKFTFIILYHNHDNYPVLSKKSQPKKVGGQGKIKIIHRSMEVIHYQVTVFYQ